MSDEEDRLKKIAASKQKMRDVTAKKNMMLGRPTNSPLSRAAHKDRMRGKQTGNRFSNRGR